MPEQTVRAQLAAVLKPLLPSRWQIVASERNVDPSTQITVRLSQQSFERHPQAPNAKLLVTFTVRILAPGQDLEKAEDVLDDGVLELVSAIDALGPQVAWSDATKILDNDRVGYDLTLTITANKPERA